MAVTKVTGSNALTNYVNKKKKDNATVSTNSGGTSLVAGANALSNSTNNNSSGGSSYVSTPSGMTLVAGANALSNATNNSSSNSVASVGGSSSGNSQYTGLGTYNDAKLSEYAKKQIEAYKAQYNEAAAKGDRAAMDAAHAAAEAIRERYGYSGGVDGSGYIELEQDEFEFDEEKPQQPQRDPRIDALLNEILNREDFSYDVTSDPLYKQYAQMYQREGDRAMKETLAEAAASAGGMNTYAITAAQQANSYYGSQLNDKIPELYQLAYEMYLNDKESKVQDLGLLQNMDATQYNRYRDTMNDWYNDRNFAYGAYRDDVGDSQWLTNLDYNDYWANKNYDNNNYWANKEFDYDEVWKYIQLGITPSAELIAKAGMSESDVNLAVAAVKAEQTNTTTSSTPSTKEPTKEPTIKPTKEPEGKDGDVIPTSNITDEIKNKAASFASNTALASYLNGLVSSNTITQSESDSLYAQFVDDNEKYIKGADGTLNISYRDMIGSTSGWEVVDNGGVNWGWGVDNNAIIKAPNGEQMRLDNLLQKLIAEGMDNAKAKDAIIALQKNLNF